MSRRILVTGATGEEAKRRFLAVAQIVGFCLRRSKMLYLSMELTPPPPRCSPLYLIVRTDNKAMSSATKAVAASSAMLPLVTAQTVDSDVGSEDGFRDEQHIAGGRVLRWRRSIRGKALANVLVASGGNRQHLPHELPTPR
jgi:hypothetical protein